MTCPECGAETVAFPVPEAVREHLPDDRPGAELCTRCLSVSPTDDPPPDYPDFTRVSGAFPTDSETAAILACLLVLLDTLALYRREADAVAEAAERRGADVLLFLDRLAAEDGLDPALDLERRRAQLEQLI